MAINLQKLEGFIIEWESLGYDRFSINGHSGNMSCTLWREGAYIGSIDGEGPSISACIQDAIIKARQATNGPHSPNR